MNLYFRLIWLLLRLPFMKKLDDPLAVTSLKMRVWPFDCDLNFHVNNGRYLTMMDLGRIQLTGLNRILWYCVKKGWMPVLGSAKIHFLKGLRPFQAFELKTQLVYWDEKWFYLEQQFYSHGTLYATALVKALFTAKQGKITPQEIITALNFDVPRPSIPGNVEKWRACESKTS